MQDFWKMYLLPGVIQFESKRFSVGRTSPRFFACFIKFSASLADLKNKTHIWIMWKGEPLIYFMHIDCTCFYINKIVLWVLYESMKEETRSKIRNRKGYIWKNENKSWKGKLHNRIYLLLKQLIIPVA